MIHRSRLDPRPILSGHLQTLQVEPGRLSRREMVEQFVVPCVAALGAGIASVSISTTTGAALLTLSGIFAAFFFQLSVQVLDRAASWAESDPTPSAETTAYARLLEDLSANTTYAALVSAATATCALGVGIAKQGWPERLLAALTIGLLVHLATTLLLVATRVFLLTRARLNMARAGHDRTI